MLNDERRKAERRRNLDAATVPEADVRRINIERRVLDLDVRSIAEWLDEPCKAQLVQGQISQQ